MEPTIPDARCVDLSSLCAGRFRLTFDGTCDAYRAERRNPWMIVVPCRAGGEIYPYSETELVYATPKRKRALALSRSIPGAVLHRDGDDATEVRIPVSEFETLIPLVHPIKRRALSPENRAKFVQAGKQYRAGAVA